MRIFETSKDDNKHGVMRVEFDGADMELLEETVDRLRRLKGVEDALDVAGLRAVTMFGQDIPTVTEDAANFIEAICKGWDAPETFTFHPGDAPLERDEDLVLEESDDGSVQ